MGVRRGLAAVGLVLAAVLAVVSVAAACTAALGMYALSVPAGNPGTEVQVKGVSPSIEPVEVRWDGVRGKVLATAPVDEATGSFAVNVTIPEAAPGVHYVVAVGGPISGDVERGWSRAAFTVPGAEPAPGDPDRGGQLELSAPEPGSGDDGSGLNTDLALGLALLGVGSVALVAGFGLLGVRRVRGQAGPGSAPIE